MIASTSWPVSLWHATLTHIREASMYFLSVYVDDSIDEQGPQLSLWTATWMGTLRALASARASSQDAAQ